MGFSFLSCSNFSPDFGLGLAGQWHCCSGSAWPQSVSSCPVSWICSYWVLLQQHKAPAPRLHQCFCLCMSETPERLPLQMFSWQTTPSPLADHNWLCFSSHPKPSMHSSKTSTRILSTHGTEGILKYLLSCCSGCSFPSFACLLAHDLGHGPLCCPSSAALSSGQGTFISLQNNGVSDGEASGTSPVTKPNPSSKRGVYVTISHPLLVDQLCPFLKGLANTLAVGKRFPKSPVLVYQLLYQKVHVPEAARVLAKNREHGSHQGIFKS